MSEVNEENIYARAAILQWATEILHGDYGCFGDIPAKNIAVLLYAIFNNLTKDSAVENKAADLVSLHDIQFCDNPTSMTCFLNAKRVLSLVQILSSFADESSCTAEITGNGSRRTAPSAVGNMTVSAWIEGKAFVEELKMWRWIRAQAFRRGLSTRELESRVQAFLCDAAAHRVGQPQTSQTGATAAECVRETTRAVKRERDSKDEEKCVATALSAAEKCASERKEVGGVVPVPAVVVQPPAPVPRGEHKEKEPLPHLTCDGTSVAPRLLSVLEEVKKELEERKSAAECADGGGGTLTCSLAAGRGGPRAHNETCGSGCLSTGCSSCPAIFAEAIRQNYNAIERLESVRRMAVAACLKKDAAGLLEALARV